MKAVARTLNHHFYKSLFIAQAIVLAASLCLWIPHAHAVDVMLEAGVMNTGPATRAAASFEVKPWLHLEVGVLGTTGGVIGDVTPMLTTTGRLRFEAGIGLSLASGERFNGVAQAGVLNFRDVVGVVYDLNKDWAVGVRAEHYSNGGSRNPAFGTHDNAGYTGGFLQLVRHF